jgi:hypothetical protein
MADALRNMLKFVFSLFLFHEMTSTLGHVVLIYAATIGIHHRHIVRKTINLQLYSPTLHLPLTPPPPLRNR